MIMNRFGHALNHGSDKFGARPEIEARVSGADFSVVETRA